MPQEIHISDLFMKDTLWKNSAAAFFWETQSDKKKTSEKQFSIISDSNWLFESKS